MERLSSRSRQAIRNNFETWSSPVQHTASAYHPNDKTSYCVPAFRCSCIIPASTAFDELVSKFVYCKFVLSSNGCAFVKCICRFKCLSHRIGNPECSGTRTWIKYTATGCEGFTHIVEIKECTMIAKAYWLQQERIHQFLQTTTSLFSGSRNNKITSNDLNEIRQWFV